MFEAWICTFNLCFLQVITNLQISRLELRDDSSIDIMRYVNKRNMEIVRVPLGDTVNEYRTRYQNIIEPHIRVLYDNKVINSIGQINKDRVNQMFTIFFKQVIL